LAKANALRMSMATYARSEDLIRIGAYQKDSDPILDKAVQNLPLLNVFLQQRPDVQCKYAEAVASLLALPS
jgi:flagellum-specific ATP synthase